MGDCEKCLYWQLETENHGWANCFYPMSFDDNRSALLEYNEDLCDKVEDLPTFLTHRTFGCKAFTERK